MKSVLRGLWVLAILITAIGSVLPGDSLALKTLEQFKISDKLEHAAAYCAVAFFPALHERRRFAAVAALCAIAMGVALEFAQLYVPGRTFEFTDMIADALGVCAGLGIGFAGRSSRAVRSRVPAEEKAPQNSRRG